MERIEHTNNTDTEGNEGNEGVTVRQNINARRDSGGENLERRNNAGGVAVVNKQIARYLGLKNTTSLRIFSNALQITRNVKNSSKSKARVALQHAVDNCSSASDNTDDDTENSTSSSKDSVSQQQISSNTAGTTHSNITNANNSESHGSGNIVRLSDRGIVSAGIPSTTVNTDTSSVGDTSNNRDNVVHRQSGDINSRRISNTTSNSGPGDTSNGSSNAESRQMSNVTSARNFGTASTSNGNDAKDGKESAKRQKTSHDVDSRLGDEKRSSVRYRPSSFVTWNCNGFSTRAVHDRDELRRLVRETQNPDLICIQEARLKAAGPGQQRGKPAMADKDHAQIRAAVADAFGGYTPFWSLADKRYAGTLTLVRKACLEASGSSSTRNTAGNYDPDLVAFSPRSAIDLMLHRFGTTRAECGLDAEQPEAKGAAPPKKQQTSLTSFFAPKKKQGAAASGKRKHHDHNAEGRFQFFFFPGMDVVQTYVPNNGTKEESFRRRCEWDKSMKKFFMDRKQILQSMNNKKGISKTNGDEIDSGIDRKLLWCGDLNASASFRDGSHWEKRGSKRDEGNNEDRKDTDDENDDTNVYEWLRDESKCLPNGPSKLPENVGMPGFTPAERERFTALLRECDFCDVWRKLHPKGVASETNNPWEAPNYSWRGAVAKNFDGFARFQGKGMRLDYFLLSPSKFCSFDVEKCEIRGHGTRKGGLFCKSDHCAVELRLKETI